MKGYKIRRGLCLITYKTPLAGTVDSLQELLPFLASCCSASFSLRGEWAV